MARQRAGLSTVPAQWMIARREVEGPLTQVGVSRRNGCAQSDSGIVAVESVEGAAEVLTLIFGDPGMTGLVLGRPSTRSAARQNAELAGHPDEEEPRVDHAAKETHCSGGDQPVQATTGLQEEGKPRNANEHGGGRVRGEPFDVAGHALRNMTSSPVQDEQACTRDHRYSEQLRAQGCRRLRSHQDRAR